MLGFFPRLYPGELLYSAIARYQIRSGNLSPKLTIEELFNSRSITANADLPCGLDNLVKNLPPHSSITVDSLIQHHTLYRFYSPFLPSKRARQIAISMRGIYGGDIHTRAGIMASAINTPNYFRFCPDCLQEDLNKYGETYWHRLHQVPGVLFCPIHKILLQNSEIPFQGFNKHEYHGASLDNCRVDAVKNDHNEVISEKLITLSQDSFYLLQNTFPSRSLEWFTKRYQTLLIERGYANSTGRVRQKRLIDDFVFFYGQDFLQTIDSMVTYEDTSNWLSQIVRKHRKVFHPIRHLLMIRFLINSLDTFFQNNRQYRPFGRSPWLCLNAAAAHYLQPVITDLKVSHCLENKKPLGTFTCSCGMIYSRSGEDKTEEDKLRIGRVRTYGQVWEDKLRELVEVKKLGLRTTARELKVDPNTIKRYVALLDLTPSWTKNKPQVKFKKLVDIDLDEIKQQKRDVWLNLQTKNPKLSKTEIRKLIPDVYAWLYRNDKQWLNNNSPKLKQPSSSVNKVDWNARDRGILIQVKSTVKQLLKEDKPVRITIGRVGSSLGLKALFDKHLDKLPQTKTYFELVTETVEDFQIRRIDWAVEELEYGGEEIKEWKILKLAGLQDNLTPKVRTYLEKQLKASKF
ncbi:MAG: TnsD family transposase [Xenococcaceae cyanobacterium MO_207.B15]|nr:TnsD family transposase [Xenococcaceae cyanobacterium MO_207.B15]